MLRQMEGSAAVAQAVARCRPEVISAYPISPQTHIVEGLSALVKDGTLAGCVERRTPRQRDHREVLLDGEIALERRGADESGDAATVRKVAEVVLG